MADVFLSYKTEDRELARVVVRGLEAHGLSVWWDQHIVMGDVWRSETTRQLDEAGAVVVLWTRISTGAIGRFVQEEAARAQRRGTYLPVQLDDCELPLGFSETQALQLAGWQGELDDPRFERLIERIRRIEHGQGNSGQSSASPAPLQPPMAAMDTRSERRSLTVLRGQLIHPQAAFDDPEYLDEITATIANVLNQALDQQTSFLQDVDGTHFSCIFGLPTGDEMAEMHAAEKALELGDLLRRVGGLDSKMAIASGMAVVTTTPGETKPRVTSNLANRADTLLFHAEKGQLLVSENGRRRLAPFFETEAASADSFAILRRTGVRDRIGAAARQGLSPLTGRDFELAELERAIRAAAAGGGQAISVIGDAGIGKSRMLHEITQRVAAEDFLILRTDCSVHARTEAFGPLRDIIRGLFPENMVPDEAAVARLYPQLAPFAATFSYLAAPSTRRNELAGPGDAGMTIAACRDALVAAIAVASESRPIALLIDDFQYADEATRDTLLTLARDIRHSRVLLAVAARPECAPGWPPMPHCRQLVLAPLAVDETSALLALVSGADSVVSGLPQLIHKRTDGVPFFIEELTRRLLHSGDFSVQRGKLTTRAGFNPLDLPKSLQGLVQARLDQLDTRHRAIVQVAAVIGHEFAWSTLRDLLCLEGAPSAHLGEAIDTGILHQVRIVPEPSYRFSQQLIQHVAANNLLTKNRRELHQRVAEQIERRAKESGESRAEELAHHFAEAGCNDQAVAHLLASSDNARKWGSARVAVEMADRAITILEGMEAEARDVAVLLDAYVAFGEALHLCRGFEDPALVEVVGKIRAIMGDAPLSREELPGAWLIWRYDYVSLNLADARTMANKIAQLAKIEDDRSIAMMALVAEGIVVFFHSQMFASRDLLLEAHALRTELADKLQGIFSTAAFYCDLFVANVLVQLGEPKSAEPYFVAAEKFAEESNSPALVLMVGSYRQMGLQFYGDFEACAKITARQTQSAIDHELYHLLAMNRMMSCATSLVRGDLAAAQQCIGELEGFFPTDLNANARLFLVLKMMEAFLTGNLHKVRECCDRLRAGMEHFGVRHFLGHVGRAELLLDWPEDRPGAEARAREIIAEQASTGNVIGRLMMAQQLALLLLADGRGLDAAAVLQEAVDDVNADEVGETPLFKTAVGVLGQIRENNLARAAQGS